MGILLIVIIIISFSILKISKINAKKNARNMSVISARQ